MPSHVAMLPDVEAERLALAEVLDGLPPPWWEVPSLCDGWTIREVVAHLTLSNRQGVGAVLWGVVRARGSFDRAELECARERAARFTPAELVAQLRETAGLDRRLAISGALDPLVDILVHAQDIVRPLGLPHPMAPHRSVAALEQVWRSPFYRPRKRFAGVRFAATDADWAAGDGPAELRGPAGELLLVSCGRRAGLVGVEGDGVAGVEAALAG